MKAQEQGYDTYYVHITVTYLTTGESWGGGELKSGELLLVGPRSEESVSMAGGGRGGGRYTGKYSSCYK